MHGTKIKLDMSEDDAIEVCCQGETNEQRIFAINSLVKIKILQGKSPFNAMTEVHYPLF